MAPQQLSTFPRSAWSETWQARSSRPPEHASQSAAHDVLPNPRSPPTANEDLGRSEQSVHSLEAEQLRSFPRSAPSETRQIGSPQPPQHANTNVSHNALPKPRFDHAHMEHLDSGSHTVHTSGYEQLEAFPKPVSPETWQGESPQPPQHSRLRLSREGESMPSSGRAHMDYLSSQKPHLAPSTG